MPPKHRKYRAASKRGPDTSTWTPAEREAHRKQQQLATPVAEMALAVRVINTLEDNDVITVDVLMQQTYESLMAMKNFGEKTLTEVKEAIVQLGLSPPEWNRPPKAKRITKPKGRIEKPILKLW